MIPDATQRRSTTTTSAKPTQKTDPKYPPLTKAETKKVVDFFDSAQKEVTAFSASALQSKVVHAQDLGPDTRPMTAEERNSHGNPFEIGAMFRVSKGPDGRIFVDVQGVSGAAHLRFKDKAELQKFLKQPELKVWDQPRLPEQARRVLNDVMSKL